MRSAKKRRKGIHGKSDDETAGILTRGTGHGTVGDGHKSQRSD